MHNIDSIQQFLEYLPLPSFVLQDNCILANTKLAVLTGYPPKYLDNRPFEEIIDPKDRSRVATEIFCCQSSQNFSKPLEFKVVTGTGDKQIYSFFYPCVSVYICGWNTRELCVHCLKPTNSA